MTAVAPALLCCACLGPGIGQPAAQNLDERQIKTLTVQVQELGLCRSTNVYALYKKSSTSTWLHSGSAVQSGTQYSSDIPLSDTFKGGDAYDYQWVDEYYYDGSSILPQCANTLDSVSVSSQFTVVGPFFTLSPSPNPFKLTRGGSGTLTVGVTRGGGFT